MSRLKNPIMALEPSLWGTLPNELLHLVFACLPVARIGQLRVLSKEWKRNIDCKDSDFNRQVFDATTHLNMFALLSRTYCSRGRPCFGGRPWMRESIIIYDVQEDKLYGYETKVLFRKHLYLDACLDAADGGLVCLGVFCTQPVDENPSFFIVMNPLTKQKMQLPPLRCMQDVTSNILVTRVMMIKLTMDKKTKDYKVFVVGSITYDGQGLFAQIYDSYTKEWTVVEATKAPIIGWTYSRRLCIYNCADRTLQYCEETDTPKVKVDRDYCVLLEDHLFVLHRETCLEPIDLLEASKNILQKYCISEFNLPKNSTTWVKLGVRYYSPVKFLYYPDNHYDVHLWGCNGFLLVLDRGSRNYWQYNLSTCEWRILPKFREFLYPTRMCTISWSAIA